MWRRSVRLGLVLAAGAGLAGVAVWPGGLRDTCVAAEVAAAPARPAAGVRAEGRLVARPGADVVVGADLGGRIAEVRVRELDRVRRGDVLLVLDALEHRAALDEARARAAEAAADVRLSELALARAERLAASAVAPESQVDSARRDLEAAAARRATAAASARRLEAVLAKTVIRAPIDGTVLERHVEPGEVLAPGMPVARVADLTLTRIEAEVDEFDAARLRLGAAATVTAEGHDGSAWPATVEEIPHAVVARGLEPQDPGRPSDARVLRVKLALSSPAPLLLGQRVEVEIAPGS